MEIIIVTVRSTKDAFGLMVYLKGQAAWEKEVENETEVES